MKLHVGPLIMLAALAFSSAAPAQGLKQREMTARDKEKVAQLAAETNRACGTQIAMEVDYPSYAHVLDDDNNQSPWAYLANATDALKSVCRSADGKQAVAAKIRSIVVSQAEAEAEIESLANGTFRYAVPYRGHSPATVVAWLKSNL